MKSGASRDTRALVAQSPGVIQASNSEAAELAYFAGRAPFAAEPAPSRLHARHDDTLGIFGNV